jgi:hypothetical protein
MATEPQIIGETAPPTEALAPVDGGAATPAAPAIEVGGRAGPDPTRYGDWEKNGRCIDF